VAEDGSRVAFLRSRSGDDPQTCLWAFDVADGAERLVADPRSLAPTHGGGEQSEAERARRERARESAGGIVAYGPDRRLDAASFGLAGRLFVADLAEAVARMLPSPGAVDEPRLDPTGRRVAYVVDGSLFVQDLDGIPRLLAGDEEPGVTWGLAEFIAAEEMDRVRGFWWSPDGERIAAARVDNRTVPTWYIGDPATPGAVPRPTRYPAAGTANAGVTLSVFEVGSGRQVDIEWDRATYPYLARVSWTPFGPMTLLVQSRDQRTACVLEIDDRAGHAIEVHRETDDAWVELVAGSPARIADGRLAVAADRRGARTVLLDGDPATQPSMQIRSIIAADREVVVSASALDSPDVVELLAIRADGVAETISPAVNGGVTTAAVGGDTMVVVSNSADAVAPVAFVRTHWRERPSERADVVIASYAEEPLVNPRPDYLTVGSRDLRCAVLLPTLRPEPTGALPVLLDPYGGPHHQRVVRSRSAYLTSQWFADRGFAVVVADGRGTPGRGAAWERAIHGDLSIALDDQVDALHGVAERRPGLLDLGRVAIRGWSFGGYLAALAVLRRPDVVHAAIAGAPVTDWRMYDTHYTERYLGHPDEDPDAYDRSSALDRARGLSRPLLLVHGLTDDNVVVAHSLRLSAALFEAERPHELLLLPNATHMAAGPSTERSLLALELDFLRRCLNLPSPADASGAAG
jgi:dipeptidyl-peptidase 4